MAAGSAAWCGRMRSLRQWSSRTPEWCPRTENCLPARISFVTRDIYDKLFTEMFAYFNKGYGPSDAVAARAR